jgi:uncharacterized protein YpuA (DUF1002 family)
MPHMSTRILRPPVMSPAGSADSDGAAGGGGVTSTPLETGSGAQTSHSPEQVAAPDYAEIEALRAQAAQAEAQARAAADLVAKIKGAVAPEPEPDEPDPVAEVKAQLEAIKAQLAQRDEESIRG